MCSFKFVNVLNEFLKKNKEGWIRVLKNLSKYKITFVKINWL